MKIFKHNFKTNLLFDNFYKTFEMWVQSSNLLGTYIFKNYDLLHTVTAVVHVTLHPLSGR